MSVSVPKYEDVLRTFLARLPEGMDKREGTLAYIAGSALALSVAELYEELKIVEENAYATTAVGEYLDKSVATIGMERRKSTSAVVKMKGGSGYKVGDIFSSGEIEYEISEVGDEYYLAKCKTEGKTGNSYIGEVVPIEDKGVEGAMNIVSIVALGEDVEDDESLRKRYIERINCPICAGNVSYYKTAIDAIEGVGGRKIVPVSEGIGTVKVIITNAEHDVASDDLVQYVKEYLDPAATSGLGFGVVPIGHKVTVESAQKVDIEIVVEARGPQSGNENYYYRVANANMTRILKEMNKNWDAQEKIVLRDRVIEDYFFDLGAIDVNVVSINGQPNRLILEENQILGDVVVNGL